MTWQNDALCRTAGVPTSRFYAPQSRGPLGSTWEAALVYCRRCPVQAQCHQAGVEGGESGIWGGVVLSGGHVAPEMRRSPLDPPTTDHRCGTVAGYTAHPDRGERRCDDCLAAFNAYRRSRYRISAENDRRSTTKEHQP